MKKKPKIGVLPLYDTQQNSKWYSLWMFPGYLDGIIAAGGIPYILPLFENIKDIVNAADDFDGFLFPGGQDVDPALYNENMISGCNEISPLKDYLEKKLFEVLYKKDKPMFGVCRGLQIFNVLLGGSLYQNLPTQYKGEILQHLQKTEFFYPVHPVTLDKTSRLYKVIGEETIRVNSMHHQGIKTLGKNVKAVGHSPDGMIEAIELTELSNAFAVQWHPEFLWDKRTYELNLFKEFVKAAGDNR